MKGSQTIFVATAISIRFCVKPMCIASGPLLREVVKTTSNEEIALEFRSNDASTAMRHLWNPIVLLPTTTWDTLMRNDTI